MTAHDGPLLRGGRNAGEWDERYAAAEFAYGTEPNAFLASVAERIPAGPALCLAEGQGRNAVFLAKRGHAVTALDQSAVGLARATELAAREGVAITTVVADLADYEIARGAWSAIISVWAHVPRALRARVHAQVVAGLAPGGAFILEAYTPAQIGRGTGGPSSPDVLPTLAELRTELAGLTFEIGREIERDVREGRYHQGMSSVVQVLARR